MSFEEMEGCKVAKDKCGTSTLAYYNHPLWKQQHIIVSIEEWKMGVIDSY